ncbi:hypothetical protein [Rhodobacter calidifons]|uniref:Lipoprotein n=1 Tax=Rhodobacter calidifons TaxID=2715277 RepID=A0ABX0G2J7_9RHOB|nr:hypothetical protein [Rhodobacter calidifons]NHB75428.1 hypothetical protein [Rhodobacter calidifons]
MKRLLPAALLSLTACGPIPLAEAERQCFERARLAQQPRGEVSVGATSAGRATAGLEVNVSSDFLLGRDPAAVYESCVMAKAGEPPSRPLYARPDWKG